MPLPDQMAQLNRRTINPLVRRVAGRVPVLSIVDHTGRTSGEHYRTPVLAFRTPDGFVIAMVYGDDSDWVRNVLAAGSATLEYRGETVPLTDPRQTQRDDATQHIPAPIRAGLRLLRVEDYLVLRAQSSAGTNRSP